MAVLFFNPDVLLTATEVQKRMNDLQHWQAEITSLQKQVAETHAWLNLVAKLIGPERAHQLIGDVLLPAQVSTSNEAIIPSEPHPRRSPVGDEVKQFLKTQTNGATGRQIIDHLLQIQEFQNVVERNNTSVYNVLSRLVKRHELRKIGTTYYPPEAAPNENSRSEEETTVSSVSSASHIDSPAGRDAEPRHTEVGKDQHASGGGPLTSTVHVGLDLAADPSEVPPQSPNLAGLTEGPLTKSLFHGEPAAVSPEVPPTRSSPTKSLFHGEPAAVSPEVPPTRSSPTKSLFHGEPAAVPPGVQIQPLNLGDED